MKLLFGYPVILILLLLYFGTAVGCAPSDCAECSPRIEGALFRLDSLIGQVSHLESEREKNLYTIKVRLGYTHSDAQALMLAQQLVEGYKVYDGDSALHYIDVSEQVARRMGDEVKLQECDLQRLFIYIGTGLYTNANEILERRDALSYDASLRAFYYSNLDFLFTHTQNEGLQNGQFAASEASESNREILQAYFEWAQPDIEDYEYQRMRFLQDPLEQEQLAHDLEQRVPQLGLNTRKDAFIALSLANYYFDRGELEKSLYYTVLSATADVAVCNREFGALHYLMTRFLSYIGYERAYNYSLYADTQAQAYKNRYRILLMNYATTNISTLYTQQQRNEKQLSLGINIGLVILLVVLGLSVLLVGRSHRKLKRSQQALDEAIHKLETSNEMLKQSNVRLESLNEELSESNYIKEEYIGQLFTLCSQQIAHTDTLRKQVASKLMAKQYGTLLKMAQDETQVQKDMMEFYHRFDTMFLRAFPNFVSDFNRLLQPDEQIVLHEGELLNTDLRIYALVRLGINNSVTIANVLHCSARTVYNYRQRMRNRAIVKEDFAQTVARLGKLHIKNDTSTF